MCWRTRRTRINADVRCPCIMYMYYAHPSTGMPQQKLHMRACMFALLPDLELFLLSSFLLIICSLTDMCPSPAFFISVLSLSLPTPPSRLKGLPIRPLKAVAAHIDRNKVNGQQWWTMG